MQTETIFDDRLAEANDEGKEEMLDTAEQLARELGEDHYETCYGDVCSACITDTPLSRENGMWMGMANTVESLTEAVETHLRRRDEDAYWVAGHLNGEYYEAFIDAAVEPDDCGICNDEIVGEGDECGHEFHGEDCPVR